MIAGFRMTAVNNFGSSETGLRPNGINSVLRPADST